MKTEERVAVVQETGRDECPLCHAASSISTVYRFEEDAHYVVACSTCLVQTILPHPSRTELTEFYENYHNTRTDDEVMPFLIAGNAELLADLRKRYGVAAGSSVRYLEIGFGNGASLLAAAQAGFECVGLDLDPGNIADVERRAKQLGLEITLRAGDGNTDLSSDRAFHLIKASQLIEHLIDPAAFVRSMALMLTSDGCLYLECPNNSALFLRLKNRLRRRYARLNFYNSLKLSEHLWGFNRRSMTTLLVRAGLDVVFCQDYPVRHRFYQPENLIWYPTLTAGLRESFRKKKPYPLLKSLIPLFDGAASALGLGGIGLATMARKRSLSRQ